MAKIESPSAPAVLSLAARAVLLKDLPLLVQELSSFPQKENCLVFANQVDSVAE
jgi:hypothetical protein